MLKDSELTQDIIGAAIEVHRFWGPGLLESIYENSLGRELELRGINFLQQIELPLIYKDVKVGEELRLDILVENRIVIEIKSVTDVLPIHEAQLLTYMRLTDSLVGFLINFNMPVLKDGIKRRVL